MNISDIPAYCITIDKTRKDRAIISAENIKKLGFKTFEFVDGVIGNNLSDDEIKKILTPRAYYETIIDKKRYSHETLSGLPSIGCSISHINLWKKCVANNQIIAIFEDDIMNILSPDVINKVYHDALAHNFDILKFTYFGNMSPIKQKITPNLVKLTLEYSCGAYIITPKCAEILLKYAYPIDTHIDQYINFVAMIYKLNIYGTPQNSIIWTNPKVSTINHDNLTLHPDFVQIFNAKEPFSSEDKCRTKNNYIIFLLLLFIFSIFVVMYLNCINNIS